MDTAYPIFLMTPKISQITPTINVIKPTVNIHGIRMKNILKIIYKLARIKTIAQIILTPKPKSLKNKSPTALNAKIQIKIIITIVILYYFFCKSIKNT